jgi:hypothetical protein
LNHNLQIEDLVVQNDSEVAFNAIHVTTGKPVLLRRFFPFGSAGRGLNDGERDLFERVVRCLLAVEHPALCKVVAGGVDPVDGFPFLASERIAGDSLEARLGSGFLQPPEAAGMLFSLLEVATLLSSALGRDGLWVETATPAILWADRENGVSPVFRISPLRSLDLGDEAQASCELVQLTEEVMGWQGVLVAGQAGNGLRAWIKELRAQPAATLEEMRVLLAASTQPKPAPSPRFSGMPAGRSRAPLLPVPRRRTKLPVLAAMAGLALIAGAVSWWFATRPPRPTQVATQAANPPPAAPGAPPSAAPAASPTPKTRPPSPLPPPRLTRPSDPPAPPVVATPSVASAPPARADDATYALSKGKVFQAEDLDGIMSLFHREVVMEGVVVRVALSGNRKIWYLEFTRTQPPDKARAFMPVFAAGPEGERDRMTSLVGKRIRVRGIVDGEIVGPQKVRRPKVLMKTRDALEVLD